MISVDITCDLMDEDAPAVAEVVEIVEATLGRLVWALPDGQRMYGRQERDDGTPDPAGGVGVATLVRPDGTHFVTRIGSDRWPMRGEYLM